AVGSAVVLPGVGRPGVEAVLARLRDGMEDPAALTGAAVVGAYVTWGGLPGPFAGTRGDDQQIFEDDAGRGGDDGLGLAEFAVEAVGEFDGAVRAELVDELAGLGIDGQDVFSDGREDAFVVA